MHGCFGFSDGRSVASGRYGYDSPMYRERWASIPTNVRDAADQLDCRMLRCFRKARIAFARKTSPCAKLSPKLTMRSSSFGASL